MNVNDFPGLQHYLGLWQDALHHHRIFNYRGLIILEIVAGNHQIAVAWYYLHKQTDDTYQVLAPCGIYNHIYFLPFILPHNSEYNQNMIKYVITNWIQKDYDKFIDGFTK